jgi:16S rRNA (uracil1498-N3)-methyltransferase
MNIFYTKNIQGNTGILDEAESHHCIKVLRLSAGDKVFIVDGKGGFYEGAISIANQKVCVIEIEKSEFGFGKRDFSLHIAIAPTKNIERFEWFLEKATEIGIDEITPILCQHSERKILREDRLEKVISSAMKQSIKAYHPVLNPLVTIEKFLEFELPEIKLMAHCMDGERHDLIKINPVVTDFVILIGPEGDFSRNEVQLVVSKGFMPVSLGASRLRTETAGVAACQIIADLVALRK